MTITDRIAELDPTLKLHTEGHWDQPLWSSPGSFSSFNDAGLEAETGELLYSFIRMLKPKAVLETGTHVGVGAAYMGLALKDNGEGHLDTVEYLPELHNQAVSRMARMDLMDQVRLHFGDVTKMVPPEKEYGMILLDTEPQTRFMEFCRFWSYLQYGGYLFIHDLHRHLHQIPNEEHGFAWPYGPIPEFMRKLVADGQARPFHFSNPRGFTGFYKVSPDDYKWK